MSLDNPTREELRELARLIVDEQERRKREPQFLDEAAAAKMCGLSPRSLQEMRYTGTGPAWVKLGTAKRSIIRYAISDLHVWMATRQRYTASDEPGSPNTIGALLDMAPHAERRHRARDLAGFMEVRRARKKNAPPEG